MLKSAGLRAPSVLFADGSMLCVPLSLSAGSTVASWRYSILLLDNCPALQQLKMGHYKVIEPVT